MRADTRGPLGRPGRGVSRRLLLRAVPLSVICLPMLGGCSSAPHSDDVAALIRAGKLDAARDAVEAVLSHGEGDGQTRLVAGALAFQAGDLDHARDLFVSIKDAAMGAGWPGLSTGIGQNHWLRLTALRSGGTVPAGTWESAAIDPLGGVIAGTMSVEDFVQSKIDAARRLADAAVLSVAQSPGRDALLDRLAREHAAEFRCTGSFIAAERAIALRDTDAARAYLEAALATATPELLETHIAKAELLRLA